MVRVVYHPLAKRDLREVLEYYENARPGLGEDFKQSFEAALHQLMVRPARGRSSVEIFAGATCGVSLIGSYLFLAKMRISLYWPWYTTEGTLILA